MQVTRIDSKRIDTKSLTKATQKVPQNRTSNYQSLAYNPIYYKPKIAFKGGFESYFPTDILDYNESSFDKLILKSMVSPDKKNRLISCVMGAAEKNNKTMSFVNMWIKAAPVLTPQGLISNLSSKGGAAVERALGTKPIANEPESIFKSFIESNHKADIIARDAKSLSAGGMSAALFHLATAVPPVDPTTAATKAGLYIASALTAATGYFLRNADSQKIQNKQFLDSCKELIKLGVVDPKDIVESATEESINLSNKKKLEYGNWKFKRQSNLRYQQTGSYKAFESDFDTNVGKSVLSKCMQGFMGMGSEPEALPKFLKAIGVVCKSDVYNRSQETQYLFNEALKIEQVIYANNPLKLIDTLKDLAVLHEENEEPIAAREKLREVFKIINNSSPKDISAINECKKNILLLDLRMLPEIIKKLRLIIEDEGVPMTNRRRWTILFDLKPEAKVTVSVIAGEAGGLLSEIKDYDIKKQEYVQMYNAISELDKILDGEEKDLSNGLFDRLEKHPLTHFIAQEDMELELYAKFASRNVNPKNALMNIKATTGEGSLFEAKFLETLGAEKGDKKHLERALEIYGKTPNLDQIEKTKCYIKYALLNKNPIDFALARDLVNKLSSEQKIQIKDEIVKLRRDTALNAMSNGYGFVFRNSIGPIAEFDAGVAIDVINEYNKNSRINFHTEQNELVDILLKHINPDFDPFAINQRRALWMKREGINQLFFEDMAKENITAMIRKIESNLKVIKFK